MDLYDWKHCAHEGIGQPGCAICDPDSARRAKRKRVVRHTEDLALARRVVEACAMRACAEMVSNGMDEYEALALRDWVRALDIEALVGDALAALKGK